MFLSEDETQALKNEIELHETEAPLRTALLKLLSSIPASEGEVEFGAKVPEKDYDEFKSYFPQYGAVKWFLGNALRAFNARVRQNPEVRFLVERSIADMLPGKGQ